MSDNHGYGRATPGFPLGSGDQLRHLYQRLFLLSLKPFLIFSGAKVSTESDIKMNLFMI